MKRLNMFCLLVVAVVMSTNTMADTYTGGIALKDTEALAKKSLPITDGNPAPLLALAVRHGSAKGHLAGSAAEAIKKQFGKAIPITITATNMGKIKDKPGCNQVRLIYHAGQSDPTETVDVAVCPRK